jgi:molybdopterin molybdotransferase
MDGMTLTVEKALETVLAHTPTLPAEDVPPESALGRVLAEDVAADRDCPPFDRAAMDGYAVRVDDAAAGPSCWRSRAQVRAGQCRTARWPRARPCRS